MLESIIYDFNCFNVSKILVWIYYILLINMYIKFCFAILSVPTLTTVSG